MELVNENTNSGFDLLPEDWVYEKLEKHSRRGSGHTPNKKFKEYYDGEIVWVSLADSNKLDNGLICESEITISRTGLKNSSATIHKVGSVILSRDAGVGKSAVSGCKLAVSQHFIVWKCNEKSLHNWFLYYWLQYNKAEFERIAVGSTIKTIGLPYFKDYKIPLPNYKEQILISNALLDIDKLINNLEKLILKKKQIKKGAVQSLFLPKKDWIVKRLGDYLDYEQPTKYLVLDTEYNDNNITPVLTAGKTFILGYTDEEYGIYNNLPVIIFDDFTTAIKFVDFPFKAKSSAMKMLIPKNDKVNMRLIYEVMSQITVPVGGDHKRHWISEYQNIEINLPSTPKEQNQIATILTDMETEIKMLEAKLEKFKKIKLGMLQNLLTGKIRLV